MSNAIIPEASASRRLPDTGTTDAPIVEVRDLQVRFVTPETTVYAINGVDFSLQAGEVLCILGESGSGKSVTLRALQRLLPENRAQIEGSIRIDGVDVLAMSKRDLTEMRGTKVAMIFQEPMTALDPVYTVGQQIAETIVRHDRVNRSAAMARALELLEMVQIPSAKRRLGSYPHELSGGLRQRAMIALALSCRPRVLLADEPTTALDATVQIQILLLLRSLQREMGMGVIFVTHDVGVAGEIADRLAVMYAGRFVETGPVVDVIRAPLHPYAEGLLNSTVHGNMRGKRLNAIAGSPPNLEMLPPGCSFAPRCPYTEDRCTAAAPGPVAADANRVARCVRVMDTPGEDAAQPDD
jgi:peptide/nickel transport system ATP-binding protein